MSNIEKQKAENKIFLHEIPVETKFKNNHNNLSNNLKARYEIYYNEQGVTIYSKIIVDEFNLNSDSKKKLFEQTLLKLLDSESYRKRNKKNIALSEEIYKAFKNKNPIRLNSNHLKTLNNFLNDLKDDEVVKLNSIFFGKNNVFGLKSTDKFFLKSAFKLSPKRTKLPKEIIKEKKEKDLLETKPLKHWISCIIKTYSEMNRLNKEETDKMKERFLEEGFTKKIKQKITNFLKEKAKVLVEFTLEYENNRQMYSKNFFKKYPPHVFKRLFGYSYEIGEPLPFQKAHIKSQKMIKDEAFKILVDTGDEVKSYKILKEISDPENILPLRADIHIAYDNKQIYYTSYGNFREGFTKINSQIKKDIDTWKKQHGLEKLPTFYINEKGEKENYLIKKEKYFRANIIEMLKNEKVEKQVIKDAEKLNIEICYENKKLKHTNEIFYLLERELLLKNLAKLKILFKRENNNENIIIKGVRKSNQEIESLINAEVLSLEITENQKKETKTLKKAKHYKINTNGLTIEEINDEIINKENSIVLKKAKHYKINTNGLTIEEIKEKVKKIEFEIFNESNDEVDLKKKLKQKKSKEISR